MAPSIYYNPIISKVLCTNALKNKIQVIRYNITIVSLVDIYL